MRGGEKKLIDMCGGEKKLIEFFIFFNLSDIFVALVITCTSTFLYFACVTYFAYFSLL